MDRGVERRSLSLVPQENIELHKLVLEQDLGRKQRGKGRFRLGFGLPTTILAMNILTDNLQRAGISFDYTSPKAYADILIPLIVAVPAVAATVSGLDNLSNGSARQHNTTATIMIRGWLRKNSSE